MPTRAELLIHLCYEIPCMPAQLLPRFGNNELQLSPFSNSNRGHITCMDASSALTITFLNIMLRYLRGLIFNSKKNLFATKKVKLDSFRRKCSSAVQASRIDNPEVASSNDGIGRWKCLWDCQICIGLAGVIGGVFGNSDGQCKRGI